LIKETSVPIKIKPMLSLISTCCHTQKRWPEDLFQSSKMILKFSVSLLFLPWIILYLFFTLRPTLKNELSFASKANRTYVSWVPKKKMGSLFVGGFTAPSGTSST
jgi:hypothetical protein